jgi:hypothetical protein
MEDQQQVVRLKGLSEQIAQELVRSQTDPNEVAKAFTYLRTHQDDGRKFFDLLAIMVKEGGYLVRSGRTLDYYREIRRVCDKYLRGYQDKPDQMAYILGWAIRLMRYYQVEPSLTPLQPLPSPRPKVEKPGVPAPPPAGPKPRRIQDLEPGMVLTGTVRRLQPYGAFVDIGVGRDGLVHISELAEQRVGSVEEVVSVGDQVTVRVKEVDVQRGRIGLSMKGVKA